MMPTLRLHLLGLSTGLVTFLGVPTQAVACQCKNVSEELQRSSADYVFEATVTAVSSPSAQTTLNSGVSPGGQRGPSAFVEENPPSSASISLADKKTIFINKTTPTMKEYLAHSPESDLAGFAAVHSPRSDCPGFRVGHRYRFYTQLKQYTVKTHLPDGTPYQDQTYQGLFSDLCHARDITAVDGGLAPPPAAVRKAKP